jgi:deferrochelatase/peroxidase EfeB
VITERKEHFGFHDGISQPAIIGLGRDNEPAENKIAPGEFILGYKNEYGQFTASPTVLATTDRTGLLPPARDVILSGDGPLTPTRDGTPSQDGTPSRDGRTQKDLGQHGSFLVFRQLEQDVRKFWDFMEAKAGDHSHPGRPADHTHPADPGTAIHPADSAHPNDSTHPADPTDMIRLASKIVGRWPSGTPLELSPEKDKPDLDDKNRFNYIPADKDGLICPFGSHVRRTNPRDSINRGDSTSIEVSKKHRLLRRGRSYGTPLAASMKPEDILRGKDDGSARGLHFICLNADLGRQFEFIQNFWINNPKFDGLYDEKGPPYRELSRPPKPKDHRHLRHPGGKAETTLYRPSRICHGKRRRLFFPARNAGITISVISLNAIRMNLSQSFKAWYTSTPRPPLSLLYTENDKARRRLWKDRLRHPL